MLVRSTCTLMSLVLVAKEVSTIDWRFLEKVSCCSAASMFLWLKSCHSSGETELGCTCHKKKKRKKKTKKKKKKKGEKKQKKQKRKKTIETMEKWMDC